MSRALIGFRFIFILESPAHKYVLQLYMYVLFVFSNAGYGLVALFTVKINMYITPGRLLYECYVLWD